MTYPSEEFLDRMADILVCDLTADERGSARAEWLDTLRLDEETTPEAHRVWLEAILRDVVVDAAIAYVDNGEFPPGAAYDECKAIVDRQVEPFQQLIAELRGIDLATLRRVEGWDD